MPEDKDVKPVDPSATIEEPADVNQESAEPSAAEPTVEQGDVQPEVQPDFEVDERGVPWKNRAQEWKRKTEELSQSLPGMIEQKLSEVLSRQQPQQAQREYTVAELEQIALENPQYRPWVEQQKEDLRLKRLSSQIEERFKTSETARTNELKKQQALNTVMQNFPEMFLKDGQGRPIGWDNSNHMTQEVSRIMQDANFANHPEGLLAAAEMAHSRMLRMTMPKITRQVQQAKAKVKKLETQTMTEGGGRPAQESKTGLRKAQERLAQTGSMQDAQVALTEYFKNKGLI